jgi:hypothetical protein
VEKWNFPTSIVTGIHFHHQPENAGEFQNIAGFIHFGDYLVKKIGVGYSGDMSSPRFDKNILDLLKLKQDDDGKLDEDYYLSRLELEIRKDSSLFSLAKIHNKYIDNSELLLNHQRKKQVVNG